MLPWRKPISRFLWKRDFFYLCARDAGLSLAR